MDLSFFYLIFLLLIGYQFWTVFFSSTNKLNENLKNAYTKWVLFSIGLSFLPFIFGIVKMLIDFQKVEWTKLISQGEMCLLSVALCATALGDLIMNSEETKTKARAVLGLLGLMTIFVASTIYLELYDINLPELKDEELKIKLDIVNFTPNVFLIGMIVSGWSVILVEKKK